MTERQRKFNLALSKIELIQQAETAGEKKVSKVMSRMLSPAIYDALTRDVIFVKACAHLGVDVNEIVEKALVIDYLLKKSESSANSTELETETVSEDSSNDAESN